MSAVEALKDQAGLCRWDYALRSLYHRAKVSGRAFPVSLSSTQQSVGSSAAASASAAGRASRSRRTEEEKLHKAYHLVCWGPN
uniref:Wound-responsive family protein n=1 Tax=Arundo donax TaxID=35708 RepID=A0A0A8XU27_ARUDO